MGARRGHAGVDGVSNTGVRKKNGRRGVFVSSNPPANDADSLRQQILNLVERDQDFVSFKK